MRFVELLSVWLLVVCRASDVAFATKTSELYSRVVVTIWFVIVPLVLGIVRFAVRVMLRYVRRQGANTRMVAIVGDN